MSQHFYIIYSESINRYYLGQTPDVEFRLQQHRNHYFKKGFTKGADDWQVLLSFQCNSVEQATYLEKFCKRMKSRKFIRRIIANPDILLDILKRHLQK